MSQYDTANVARMICDRVALEMVTQPISADEYKHISVPKIDVNVYDGSVFLKSVLEIYNMLNVVKPKYIKHFLLHGSLADFGYVCGWSDLDTWVVIDNKACHDPIALVELRNLFSKLNEVLLKIDPIAHHGFIVVLESDLDNYDSSLLPIEVIKTARNLYGSPDIQIRESGHVIDWIKRFKEIKNTFVEFEISGVFKHHAYKGEYLTKDMIKRNEGMYQFKYLIGMVMFLPSMYYTAIGKPTYKSKSFEPFLKSFPASRPIIECVSKIRTDWGKMERHPYTPNNIPDWVIDRLPLNYVLQIIQLLDSIDSKLLKIAVVM